MRRKPLYLTQAAVIAALYVVLTELFAPISFKEVQVRVSEMLTVLPAFTPAAIPGLAVGCLIANILGGALPPDVVFGSLATLAGACGTYLVSRALRRNKTEKAGKGPDDRKRNQTAGSGSETQRPDRQGLSSLGSRLLVTLPPVIANTIVVPLVLKLAYGVNLPLALQMLTVGLGEVVSCTLLGGLLLTVLSRYGKNLFGQMQGRT